MHMRAPQKGAGQISGAGVCSINNRRLSVLKQLEALWKKPVVVRCKVATLLPNFEAAVEQIYELQHSETSATFQQQLALVRQLILHRDSECRDEIVIRQRNKRKRHRS